MGAEIDQFLAEIDYNVQEFVNESNSAATIFSNLTGFVANWIQIGTAVIPAIIQYINNTPTDAQLIEELESHVADVLSEIGVLEQQFLMLSLKPPWIAVQSDLETIGAEAPAYEAGNQTDIDPKAYFKDSLDFLGYVTDDTYWYRAFLSDRTYYPLYVPGLLNAFGWNLGWYGELPQPSSTPPQNQVIPRDGLRLPPLAPLNSDLYPGWTTVLDPQAALPAYLKAVAAFLAINLVLKGKEFDTFITQWNDNLMRWADDLEARYNLLVAGVVKSDEPSVNDVLGYIGQFLELGVYGYELESAWTPAPTGGKLSPPRTGSAWNGVYGVVDMFGVYTQPVPIPSCSGWHIVHVFPMPPSVLTPVDPYVGEFPERIGDVWLFTQVIPWVVHRVRIGLMARWKAIYLFRGYDKAWSVLQSLRVLTKQQKIPLRDVNKDWSLRELFGAIDAPTYGDPLGEYPDGTLYNGFVLSDLIRELWDIADSTWEKTWPTSQSGSYPPGEGGVIRDGLRKLLKAACA
jgi:hypothetical protein